MRFYHPATSAFVHIRRPRAMLFLLGPIYLASLRLWKDAAVLTVVVVLLVYFSIGAMRIMLGDAAVGGLGALWQAFENVVGATGDRDASVDEAYRAFVALTLPYYAAAFVLLLLGATLAVWAPQYFAWRFRRMGYVQLQLETQDELEEVTEF